MCVGLGRFIVALFPLSARPVLRVVCMCLRVCACVLFQLLGQMALVLKQVSSNAEQVSTHCNAHWRADAFEFALSTQRILEYSLITPSARPSLPNPALALDPSWPGPITEHFEKVALVMDV